jgi:hypothetical protein
MEGAGVEAASRNRPAPLPAPVEMLLYGQMTLVISSCTLSIVKSLLVHMEGRQ